MKVYLIRHGKTAGNQEARYVGSTDESILEEERTRLQEFITRKWMLSMQVPGNAAWRRRNCSIRTIPCHCK